MARKRRIRSSSSTRRTTRRRRRTRRRTTTTQCPRFPLSFPFSPPFPFFPPSLSVLLSVALSVALSSLHARPQSRSSSCSFPSLPLPLSPSPSPSAPTCLHHVLGGGEGEAEQRGAVRVEGRVHIDGIPHLVRHKKPLHLRRRLRSTSSVRPGRDAGERDGRTDPRTEGPSRVYGLVGRWGRAVCTIHRAAGSGPSPQVGI